MDTEIKEIFSSIQGEGMFAGERHLFIRFADCNLSCRGCDENEKPVESMSVDAVMKEVLALEDSKGPHRFVALTGGEPLCHNDFLRHLNPRLKHAGFNILLETNGTLAQQFSLLAIYFSVVSMDIKLRSVWNGEDCFAAHDAFLSALDGHEGYIKIVISSEVDQNEFMRYIERIACMKNVPAVVLHPYSHTHDDDDHSLYALLADMQRDALKYIRQVRVLPRVHKIMMMY